MYGVIQMQKGFVHADETKIAHGEAIDDLLEAIKLVVVKCAGYKIDSSLITKWNNLTDEAGKQAAGMSLQLSVKSDTKSEQLKTTDITED